MTATLMATLAAQCNPVAGYSIVPLLAPTTALAIDDEGRSADLALLGFTFPIGGSSYSHFVVETNGEVYLTNGSGVVDPAQFGVSTLSELRGGAGASPRVMALSGDLEAGLGQANWDILVDDTTSGQVTITWTGVRAYFAWQHFQMSVTLYSTGAVQFAYGEGDFRAIAFGYVAGISAGDAIGTGVEAASDLNGAADSGALPLLFQSDWQPFDLTDHSILVWPNGLGGYSTTVTCGLARHLSFGDGCYDVGRESCYQHFTDAAVAAVVLTGNGMVLAPSNDGMVAVWLPNAASALYVPPSSAAVVLPVGNDGQVTRAFSLPFPLPQGQVHELTVQGNGILGFGPGPVGPQWQNYLPEPARMLAGSHGGIYCWHAYNADEGGDVWWEELGGVTYVTFLDVENFPLTTSNPSTFQVQFHHATGEVFLAFVHIDSDNSLIYGSHPQDHLIGYTPPGASIDPGGVDFAVQAVVATMPDVRALRLHASPDAISTAGAGSSVTYGVEHALPANAGGAAVIGVVALATAWTAAMELSALGAAGCWAQFASPAITSAFAGPLGPQAVVLSLPPGIPPGTCLYAQAASFALGSNPLGIITSNAIETVVSIN